MHVPVLEEEALAWLNVHAGGTYVDCTVGLGGHASRIAAVLSTGRLIAIDRDLEAVKRARGKLEPFQNARVFHRNYDALTEVLTELGIRAVDGILLDAGISSFQLDTAERGFSFQKAGPLDMRMDTTSGQTAAQYLAEVDAESLAQTLREFGDVGPSKRIARTIVQRSASGKMSTTEDLRKAVADALDNVREVPEEVRTVFQAIRIAVNGELDSLRSALHQGIDLLAPHGRFVVVSFHSGEDRLTKNVFRDASRTCRVFKPDGRLERESPPAVRLLTKTPITPSAEERAANPRAASAKLRAVERLPLEGEAA